MKNSKIEAVCKNFQEAVKKLPREKKQILSALLKSVVDFFGQETLSWDSAEGQKLKAVYAESDLEVRAVFYNHFITLQEIVSEVSE